MSQIFDGRNEHSEDSKGIRLLKKSRKGLIHMIFSRFGIILLLLVLQVVAVLALIYRFQSYTPIVAGISVVFSLVMVFYIFNKSSMDASSKMTWLLVIMIFQIFGAVLFFYTRMDVGHRRLKEGVARRIAESRGAIKQDEEALRLLEEEDVNSASLVRYINRTGCYPVYNDSEISYFPSGEAKFKALLEELKKAEKFIFLEYFIIDEGIMWGRILEILAEKAKQGVDVRVMYDGTCEMSLLPHNYPEKLRELGIKCKVFAPMRAFVSTHYNYRDHRKILVIDGKTAFNGGVNLADEYINEINRFGYWKDTAVMVKGGAVRSYTLMFLQLWTLDEEEADFSSVDLCCKAESEGRENKGYVLPYADCPLDGERVGESVYIDILYRAKRYVHIMTPYLILDGELETALKFAAQRGVDVRLIIPGIPDKKVAYALAKSHYEALREAGVRIFEFTPGFVHAKVFVSDDKRAVVGTINLDYRSLYHHFECATYMYKAPCISEIEEDFQETLKACSPVTEESIKNEKLYYKIVGKIVKLVAPLF